MYGFNLLSLLFIVDIIYHSINRARQFTKLVYRINSGFLFSTVSIIAIFKLDSTGVCVINIVNIHDDIIYVESITSRHGHTSGSGHTCAAQSASLSFGGISFLSLSGL